MNGDLLICPLCGFEFEKADTACRHGCPLSPLCNLVRCPSCDYEFADRPRRRGWLAALFGGRRECRQERDEGILDVAELAAGQRARVVHVGGGSTSRRNALAVFGLAPGSEITLLQRRPSCVIRVGETELALDAEIARRILVEPWEPGSRPADGGGAEAAGR